MAGMKPFGKGRSDRVRHGAGRGVDRPDVVAAEIAVNAVSPAKDAKSPIPASRSPVG